MTTPATTLPPSPARHRWLVFKRRMEPVLFISPAFIVIAIILIYPLGYSFWLSFHEWTLRGFRQGIPFVGLQNYLDLFANPDFVNSLRITFSFVILAVGIEFVLGMGLALLLNHDLRGKNYIRALILLPMMCTNVVIGLTWRLLLNYEFGLVNYYLGVVGHGPGGVAEQTGDGDARGDPGGCVEYHLVRRPAAPGGAAGPAR